MGTNTLQRRNRLVVLFGGTLTSIIALGALAWACTPTPAMEAIIPLAGPAGTQITIAGSDSFGTAVEVHWGAADGPVIANLPAGGSRTLASVPAEARPGVYAVVALTRAPNGAVQYKTAQPYEVTGPSAASADTANGLWSGLSRSTSPGEAAARPATPGPSAAAAGLFAIGIAGLAVASAGAILARRRVSRADTK